MTWSRDRTYLWTFEVNPADHTFQEWVFFTLLEDPNWNDATRRGVRRNGNTVKSFLYGSSQKSPLSTEGSFRLTYCKSHIW